ncbi:nuclear transport factor 2 family protein [Dictyobacter aurantiacus]|uniref:SnoaL-like domain-containing protein n=1 Tax=Dictyobacter aurantiacus TaxID=1936993 RepID=A0A401ZJ44_9CHLR|nr:nuclear transport factor 2 family protein [Dictyobacter aurantiacus]GCE06863.1 hypothetical protein KDAU_41920 [Dictyobacter aurantiacus]
MNASSFNHLILTYVEGWKAGDRDQILGTLDPACVVIESYGPAYRGTDMVGRWIDSWFAPGNIVNRWDITSFFEGDDFCCFEWTFECTYDGHRSGFEGASIACFNNEKIVYLREYAMTAPRYEWDG